MSQPLTIPCFDCGGTGIDPGSLHQPEECPECCGAGNFLAPAEIERTVAEYHERRPMGLESQWREAYSAIQERRAKAGFGS